MATTKEAPKARIFLGKDEATYGKEGTGYVLYDPDFECGGSGPDRQCPYTLQESELIGNEMELKGGKGRLLHVGLASYRDPLCPTTLYNMFTKAKKPSKIHVRVIQQNDPELDVDCLEAYCAMMEREHEKDDTKNDSFFCPYADQIYIHQIHAKDAKGPTFARGHLSHDWAVAAKEGKMSPQDHCLSMDSHMDFEPHWDESMVEMWDMAENEYAVLSTYVDDIENLGSTKKTVPHLCMVMFTSNVRTTATKLCRNLPRPKLTNAVYGAGLAYSKCHAELKVPVDPHTPYIFDGEEFNRAARLFTYGYDIYTPHHVYILHNYHGSQHNPTTASWHRNTDHVAEHNANVRMLSLLDVPGGSTDEDEKLLLRQSKYGLGDRRTLDQLIQFSGIDLRHKRVTIDGKNRCGNIRWVPFEEHEKGVNHIPKFDENENPLEDYDGGSIWENPSASRMEKEQEIKVEETEEVVDNAGDTFPDRKALYEPEHDAEPIVEDVASTSEHVKPKILESDQVINTMHHRRFQFPSRHGLQHLPLPVQASVGVLSIGLVLALIVMGRNGPKIRRGRSDRRKKRSV